ncbi:hypothetical protein CN063_29100, partial [Sinorhizobium meliloti]|uniref:hypothetical protein n=2 Tax=Rhizobium meliloti TaxID=382 RepID=UPI000FE03763
GRHHLGIRGRLFLGIGGRDHFGIRGRIASEFAVGWKKMIMAAFGMVLVAISAYYTAGILGKLGQLESTFRQASSLVSDRRTKHTNEGFVLAALAFLEAKKQQLPDTYMRALEICERYGCVSPDRELQDKYNSIEAASIFESILEGIAVMNEPEIYKK